MNRSKQGTAYDFHSGPSSAANTVVVLIHGLGLTRQFTWEAIAPKLAEHYPVLSYDLPGHGQSALPNLERDVVDLSYLSHQLFELLDELAIQRAALVGFSLGGMINRRCALDQPERVQALAILNSPHDRGTEQQAIVEQRALDAMHQGPQANLQQTLERWLTPEFRLQHPQTVQRIRDTVLANHPASYAAHRWVLAQGVKELIQPQPPLAQPTLVMTCQNDQGSNPAMSQAIAAEIQGAELDIVPELQHLGLIEQPDLFARRLLAFLSRHV